MEITELISELHAYAQFTASVFDPPDKASALLHSLTDALAQAQDATQQKEILAQIRIQLIGHGHRGFHTPEGMTLEEAVKARQEFDQEGDRLFQQINVLLETL